MGQLIILLLIFWGGGLFLDTGWLLLIYSYITYITHSRSTIPTSLYVQATSCTNLITSVVCKISITIGTWQVGWKYVFPIIEYDNQQKVENKLWRIFIVTGFVSQLEGDFPSGYRGYAAYYLPPTILSPAFPSFFTTTTRYYINNFQ